MATYGSVVFGSMIEQGSTYGCDAGTEIGKHFATSGELPNKDSHCKRNDLAALSKNLGTFSGLTRNSATFAVGFDRKHAIDYLNSTQTGLYRSQWPTVGEAIDYFLKDHEHFQRVSAAFDKQVRSRSEAVSSSFGSKYADIVEASVRQTFGTSQK